jgi:hypothetical protein
MNDQEKKPTHQQYDFGGLKGNLVLSDEMSKDAVIALDSVVASAFAKQLDQQVLRELDNFSRSDAIDRVHKAAVDFTAYELIQAITKKLFPIGIIPNNDEMPYFSDEVVKAMRRILEEMRRPKPTQPPNPNAHEMTISSLDALCDELTRNIIVKDARILLDDYPEKVTIMVTLSMVGYEDAQVQQQQDEIVKTIKFLKPKGLDVLEVIYHIKEVF